MTDIRTVTTTWQLTAIHGQLTAMQTQCANMHTQCAATKIKPNKMPIKHASMHSTATLKATMLLQMPTNNHTWPGKYKNKHKGIMPL